MLDNKNDEKMQAADKSVCGIMKAIAQNQSFMSLQFETVSLRGAQFIHSFIFYKHHNVGHVDSSEQSKLAAILRSKCARSRIKM